ncbi:hypothetical protein R1flu_022905 [Riccia fluitans]|uniref:Mediator of RNA polymerase II transcription subunit 4 n=1 Tax=Riccia fluitans TaxID=41844 RepID=A0ABD1XQI6_9MARC
MSGGFAVSRRAGRALMGVCIALPAAALVVRSSSPIDVLAHVHFLVSEYYIGPRGMATAELLVQNLSSRGAQGRNALQSVPPQRRAQLLLLNMAGLTNRLLEVAGSKDWQSGQSKLMIPPLLQGAVLPSEGAAATTSKEILGLLDYHQTLLFEAIAELGELQEMEIEKQRIAEAIASKDSAMRDFAKRVRDAQQVLEATVEEFDDYRRTKRKGISEDSNGVGLGTINVQELVAYAHRISYTTFAPPEYAEGAPLRGALPPAPQDEQMRMSRLYQVNELDLGLPKPVERVVSPVATDGLLDGKAGFLPQTGVPGGLPPPPPGWKPGMRLELPLELPPMPPGWKPGDPIPLPADMPPLPPAGWKPGDAVVLPPAFAPLEGAAPAGPIKAPALPPSSVPAPGVIHVPFVQLDLNPELEDEYDITFLHHRVAFTVITSSLVASLPLSAYGNTILFLLLQESYIPPACCTNCMDMGVDWHTGCWSEGWISVRTCSYMK